VTRAVPAIARALDLLELFLEGAPSLGVPDIAIRLGLPRSSVHEIAQTLLARGYLAPLELQPHRFTLGPRLFELGNAYANELDLAREGQQVARAVAAACDETVHLAILDGTQVVYIAKVDSTHAVRMVSVLGGRLPAHCTAVGKMLLSGLSDADVSARYAGTQTLVGMTPNSLTSLGRLRQELVEIRGRALAYDDCESNAAVRCVAAPVYDHRSELVAAMSVSVPIIRMDDARRDELGELVRRGADDLSRRLGYKPAIRSVAVAGS
jgi:IclR family transcriptional regulator, KDG regulon repressor